MPKPRREETGFLPKSERQKLQKLRTQGDAADASVRNLVKTSNLSSSKLTQFLSYKPSYTKLTAFTRHFMRMKAFFRYINDIWCMDLAYVEKLAKINNGPNYLPNRKELFDWTVDADRMKKKAFKEAVCAFLTKITKKNWLKKICVNKEQNLLESWKSFAKLQEYKLTLQWMRLKLHLLNVQYDPSKLNFTVTWKVIDTISFTKCLNASQPWFPEKNCLID